MLYGFISTGHAAGKGPDDDGDSSHDVSSVSLSVSVLPVSSINALRALKHVGQCKCGL